MHKGKIQLLIILFSFINSFISPVLAQQINEKVKIIRQEAEKIFKNIEVFEINDITGVPCSIRGKLESNVDLNKNDQIVKFLKNSGKVFPINTNTDDFEVKKEFFDNLNLKHAKVQQTFNGIPVWGSEMIVHSDINNTVVEVNGRFTPYLALNVQPSISSSNALQIALSDMGPAEYRWENPEQEKILKEVYKDGNLSWKPKPELVIAPKRGDFDKGEYRLSWKMQIAVDGAKLGNYEYFVDAITGEIINKFNSMADVNGSGVSNYNGTVQFSTTLVSANYQLYDSDRHLTTYTANGLPKYPGTLLTDSDNYWDQNKSAVDAHWGAMKIYDFYKNVFNRNSFDDAGAEIISTVQCTFSDGTGNNAQWDGSQMLYGGGDGSHFSSVTSLDVCGHEITHAVTTLTANLVYQGESGALNEALSDIFGTAIEFYSTPSKANWLIGEECYTPRTSGDALRYMNNPNLGYQPDTYNGTYWASTSNPNYYNDYGGVHTNSGVLNYAFYLMSVGGSGTNDLGTAYNVTGITIEKARAIAYKALTTYLTSSSNYLDARNAFLSAAAVLYGSNSAEYKTVSDAFGAVGIGIRFTAENSFNAGTIKINGFTTSNGSNFFATGGSSQTLEAIPQFYTLYNYVWNTSGLSISNWKKRLPGGSKNPIYGATNISYTFNASSTDANSAYIADLKKLFNISRTDLTEVDGNISAGIVTTIAEDNSGTVPAPLQQIINGKTYNFAGWADGSNGTITPTDNMSLNALYKLSTKSNSQTAFSNTGQRKFIRTSDGYLHLVYESMNKIWYESSTDGGASWTIQNNGKPLNTDYKRDNLGNIIGTGNYTVAKHPSMDNLGNNVVITWQEQSGTGYVIKLAFMNNGIPADIVNNIPFTTPYGQYAEDVTPVIAIKEDNHLTTIALKRNDSNFQGIECHYLILGSSNGISTECGFGTIPGTNANSKNITIATDKASTDKFHVAWQQDGSGYSNINYARFNFINKTTGPTDPIVMTSAASAAAVPGNPVPMVINVLLNKCISNTTYNTYNYSPSIIAANDGSARVSFKGYYEYDPGYGNYAMSLVNPDNLSYIPYLNKYGGDIYSSQLSLGSDTYFMGWTEFYNNNYRTICTDSHTLSDMETVNNAYGKDFQINNGGSKDQQYVMTFNSESSTLPYSFRRSDAIGSIVSNKKSSISRGRSIFLTKDNAQLHFILGNVNADGLNVNFVDVQDTVKLNNIGKVNSYLITEPFNITDNSTFNFAVSYGSKDSVLAKSYLQDDKYCSFKVELVEANSGKVLGSYLNVTMNKDNIFKMKESSFKVSGSGAGSQLVRLRLSVDENMNSQYTVSDMLLGKGILLSKSSVEENEINYKGTLEVKDFALEQNYPNPFNPSTAINYALSKAAYVSLKVYDVLGKEVKTLVNEYKAEGKYSVEFNANSLPSGTYVYQLKAGNNVISRKMMLVK